jgi:hypothetical protein
MERKRGATRVLLLGPKCDAARATKKRARCPEEKQPRGNGEGPRAVEDEVATKDRERQRSFAKRVLAVEVSVEEVFQILLFSRARLGFAEIGEDEFFE